MSKKAFAALSFALVLGACNTSADLTVDEGTTDDSMMMDESSSSVMMDDDSMMDESSSSSEESSSSVDAMEADVDASADAAL